MVSTDGGKKISESSLLLTGGIDVGHVRIESLASITISELDFLLKFPLGGFFAPSTWKELSQSDRSTVMYIPLNLLISV